MTEQDIILECGDYWVCRDKEAKQYVVYKVGVTHSTSDSSYAMDEDGLSIAIYRCKYMAKKG